MIYRDLFLGFLKVGCFAFGGAYGAIPLIREVVLSYGWLDDEALAYMIAISESTPGPIMVNLATYVGSSQGGLWGALLATSAVVFPSFVIILLITALLKTLLKNRCIQTVLSSLQACVIGIVLATGADMVIRNLLPSSSMGIDLRSCVITAILAAILVGYRRLKKKKLSPIVLILISAAVGILTNRF